MMKIKTATYLLILAGSVLIFAQCNNSNNDNKEQTKETPNKTERVNPKENREKPKLVYDDRGNVIERHAKSYRKTDNTIRSEDSYYYEYDENNNVVVEIKESYNTDGTLKYKNVNHYAYNEQNLKTEQIFESFDGEDILQRKTRNSFEYNDNGYKIHDVNYFDDGSVKSEIFLDPDENGALNWEEYIHYNPDGTKRSHMKYYYSQFGLERTENLMEEGK